MLTSSVLLYFIFSVLLFLCGRVRSLLAKDINGGESSPPLSLLSEHRVIRRLVSEHCCGPNATTALDLFCGVGGMLPLLSQHAKEVLAVDSSKELLLRSEMRCKRHGCRNVTLKKVGLSILPPPPSHSHSHTVTKKIVRPIFPPGQPRLAF
jgi:hypothetical protein